MDASVKEVRDDGRKFRIYYLKQKKLSKENISETGSDEKCVSTWPHYEFLNFLDDKLSPRESQSNDAIQFVEEVPVFLEKEVEEAFKESNSVSQHDSVLPPKKKPKVIPDESRATIDLINTIETAIKSQSSAKTYNDKLFGARVINHLKNIHDSMEKKA